MLLTRGSKAEWPLNRGPLGSSVSPRVLLLSLAPRLQGKAWGIMSRFWVKIFIIILDLLPQCLCLFRVLSQNTLDLVVYAQQRFISHSMEADMSKIKVPAILVSGLDPLLSSQTAVFLLCSHIIFLGPLYKCTNPFYEGSTFV